MKTLVPADIVIEKKILMIRGQKVILDKDLAEIYGVSTKALNQAVKRNKERFPEDFMFQLTEAESDFSRSQIVTLKRGSNIKYLPYAFTEHGAIQAANVLNSERAVEMGVAVVRAFVRMRELIVAHKDLAQRLDEMEKKYDTRFKFVFDAIKKLIDSPQPPTKPIGFLSDEQKKAASSGRIVAKEGGLVYVNSMKLSGPEDAAGIFYDLKNQDREKFVTLLLNKDNEILGCEVVSVGTLNASLVHPREALKVPVKLGASKIVLVHNHPTGIPTPSENDIALTKRLSLAANLVGIEVLYHVVIGRNEYCVFNNMMDPSGRIMDSSGRLLKSPEVYPIVKYEARAEILPDDKPLSARQVNSPAAAVEFVRPLFNRDEPLALGILLDARNNIVSIETLGARFDERWTRQIAGATVAGNAAAYIICANYEISTGNLKELESSGKIMGVPMLDYITLDKDAGKGFVSKRKEGAVREVGGESLSLSDSAGGQNLKLDDSRRRHDKNVDDAFKSAAEGNSINLSALMIGAEQIHQAGARGKDIVGSTLGSDNWDDSKNRPPEANKRQEEGKVMMKVAERAAKGTYIARITGVDDHMNVQREFLKAELKFGDKKGLAEVFIDPETLKEGDVVSMKVVRAAGDKPKENFYKIVADPTKSPELHNVVKKIVGGKEEVVKMLMRSSLVDGRKITGSKNLLVATDIAAGKKSYVAKITGPDEKFGFKREFIGEIKESAAGGGKPECMLEVGGDSIKEGNIIAVKVVKGGEDPKAAKESYWRVEKDPAEALELREVARKITREEASKAVGADLAKTSGDVKKNSPEMSRPADDPTVEAVAASIGPAKEDSPAGVVRDAASGRAKTSGHTM